jgi:hypothetical protein
MITRNFSGGKMQYKCVPAPKNLVIGHDGSHDEAVRSFADLINREATDGWKFHSMEQVSVTQEPPKTGCLSGLFILIGLAQKPAAITRRFNMLIFSKETSGKDISLSDMVKDSESKWAHDGDVKVALAKAKADADAKAAAEWRAAEAKAAAAKAAAEQKEKEAFRQRYKETTGKDISLSDVVKDSEGKWAFDGDIKAAAAALAKAKQRKKRNIILGSGGSGIFGGAILGIILGVGSGNAGIDGVIISGVIVGGVSSGIILSGVSGIGGVIIGGVIGGAILGGGIIGGGIIIGGIGGAIIGIIAKCILSPRNRTKKRTGLRRHGEQDKV